MNAAELNNGSSEQGNAGAWLEIVRELVGSLEFGIVQIIVHAI
jgi:hypothetical protein